MKNDRLSAEQEAVLAAYGRKGTILRACQGICDRVTHYRWMNTIPEYRERFQLAKEEFADKLLDYVTELSLEGEEVELWDKKGPVMQDGKVLVQRKKNHRFLGQLLKIHFSHHKELDSKDIYDLIARTLAVALQAAGLLVKSDPATVVAETRKKMSEHLSKKHSYLNVTECNTETPVAAKTSKAEVPPPRKPISPEYIGSCNALGRPLRLNMQPD